MISCTSTLLMQIPFKSLDGMLVHCMVTTITRVKGKVQLHMSLDSGCDWSVAQFLKYEATRRIAT